MTLRRYERYKDSGVEWLGAVPAHWDVLQLRRVIDRIEQGWSPECENRPAEEGEWGVLKTGCVNGGRFNPLENKALPSQLEAPPELEVAPNDLLMSRASGSPELVGSAALVNDTPPRLLLSDKTFRLHVNQRVDKQFLAWCLGSRLLRAQIECAISGAAGLANNLPQASLVEFASPFPPVHEQRAIAAYLNRETTKIDALIVEQQRLIELLNEKRQAVIAHSVTKGLNPAAPMKDSGVEWLGKVPSHWEVARLGRFATVRSGYAFPSTGFSLDDMETRLLRGINVGVGALRWDEVVYWKRQPDDGLDAFALSAGDVVLGMDRPFVGDGTRVARISAADLPCLLLQRVASIHPSPGLLPGYLIELLESSLFVHHIGPETTGVSVPHISPGQVCDFRVPVPPISEQLGIVRMIEEAVGKTEALTSDASTAVALLLERRTALISAAVTGQIDVRNSASVESALAETRADIAAGRYVVESAAAHVARVQAMATADEHPSAPPRSC
ncbi:MAG TPA: hypothetical protein PLO41_02440 [Rubrivivax sp.]|nr:hypothetical protein [Rubrivivax sp.]